MARESERRAAFKKTIDESDGRRRREETTRQIRKNKREDQMRKRRMGMEEAEQTVIPADQVEGAAVANEAFPKKATIEDLPMYKSTLESPSSTMEELIEATRGIRRLLSVDRDPPVDAVLNAGLLPYLIRNLTATTHASTLIFESAWALTNIASTSMTHVVVEAAGIEPLVQLLRHENPDVREQAAWCLGNIAGDTTEYRDLLLCHGIVEPLILNITQPANMSLLNNVIWTVSNLCRGKPAPDMMYLAPLLPHLGEVLFKPVSMDVLVDAVWALSYLSDGPNHRIELVMQTGVTSKLIEFLSDTKSPLITPTLRCLGNFVTGSDEQTQAVLDAGVIHCLNGLLDHHKKNIQKETCWLASNIAAGTPNQITMLLREQELMASLIEKAKNANFDVKKEAVWTLSNICTTGTPDHIRCLVDMQGLTPLADVLGLSNADASILGAVLDALEKILQVGEQCGESYSALFDECDGIDHLEALQEHPSNAVYEKTVKIIETYFGNDDFDDENIAPETTANGTFGFGIEKQLFPADRPVTFSFGAAPTNF